MLKEKEINERNESFENGKMFKWINGNEQIKINALIKMNTSIAIIRDKKTNHIQTSVLPGVKYIKALKLEQLQWFWTQILYNTRCPPSNKIVTYSTLGGTVCM